MLPQYAFADYSEGVYIRTRVDGKLFNIARLFADDNVLEFHSETGLQCLVDKLSHACKKFSLTFRTKILAQDAQTLPVITTDNTELGFL